MRDGDANSQAAKTVEIRPPSARAEAWHVLRVAALIVLATWIYLADTTGPPGGGISAGSGFGSGPGGGAGSGAGALPAAGSAGGGAGAPMGAGAGGSPVSGVGGVAGAVGAAASERDLMPYQKLFRDCDSVAQRMFRELQEGLLEAENRRSATAAWPSPQDLAAAGVPPFADRAGGRRGAYRWELRRAGLAVNYLGVPQGGGAQFLLLIQEPDPLAPDATAPPAGAPIPATDEVHQRLADGTLLHVSTWMRVGSAAAAAAPAPAAAPPGVLAMPAEVGWTQILAGASRP